MPRLTTTFDANTAQAVQAIKQLQQAVISLNRTLGTGQQSLANANRNASQSINRLRITANSTASDLTGGFNRATTAAGRLSNAVRNVFTAGIASGLVAGLVRVADTYTNIGNRLRVATRSQEEFSRALRDTLAVAQETRQQWQATVVLYQRISSATRDVGLQHDRLINFVRTTNQILTISGATMQEARSATLQLSQAIGSGVLRGEEFNAVNEAAPQFIRLVAQSIGVQVGQMRELAAQGVITRDVILEAIEANRGFIDIEFARTTTTLGQAFSSFTNALIATLGSGGQGVGAIRVLTGLISTLTDNVDLLITAGLLLASVFAIRLVAGFAATGLGVASLASRMSEIAFEFASTGRQATALGRRAFSLSVALDRLAASSAGVGVAINLLLIALAGAFLVWRSYRAEVDRTVTSLERYLDAERNSEQGLENQEEAARRTTAAFIALHEGVRLSRLEVERLAEAQGRVEFLGDDSILGNVGQGGSSLLRTLTGGGIELPFNNPFTGEPFNLAAVPFDNPFGGRVIQHPLVGPIYDLVDALNNLRTAIVDEEIDDSNAIRRAANFRAFRENLAAREFGVTNPAFTSGFGLSQQEVEAFQSVLPFRPVSTRVSNTILGNRGQLDPATSRLRVVDIPVRTPQILDAFPPLFTEVRGRAPGNTGFGTDNLGAEAYLRQLGYISPNDYRLFRDFPTGTQGTNFRRFTEPGRIRRPGGGLPVTLVVDRAGARLDAGVRRPGSGSATAFDPLYTGNVVPIDAARIPATTPGFDQFGRPIARGQTGFGNQNILSPADYLRQVRTGLITTDSLFGGALETPLQRRERLIRNRTAAIPPLIDRRSVTQEGFGPRGLSADQYLLELGRGPDGGFLYPSTTETPEERRARERATAANLNAYRRIAQRRQVARRSGELLGEPDAFRRLSGLFPDDPVQEPRDVSRAEAARLRRGFGDRGETAAEYLDNLRDGLRLTRDIGDIIQDGWAGGVDVLSRSIASSLATGRSGFRDLAQSFLQDMSRVFAQLAIEAAAISLINSNAGQAAIDFGASALGSILPGLGGFFGGGAAGPGVTSNPTRVPGFAGATAQFGGDFQVGGNPGIDSNLLAVSPGEIVRVRTPQQIRQEQENPRRVTFRPSIRIGPREIVDPVLSDREFNRTVEARVNRATRRARRV